jgi:hypothetical protein
MNSAKRYPNKSADIVIGYVLLALVVWICMLLGGCAGTVRPTLVTSAQASWDGNRQNSGLIGRDTAGNFILTPHAHDRYVALVSLYATNFNPKLTPEPGLSQTSTNTFLMDAQHMEYFARMSRWKKQEAK